LPGEPLFLSDWDQVVMIHYEVDGEALRRVVPFELELWDGRAFVSVVAFTMRRMRPRMGGRVAELLFRPISTHEFLNVRTYVRHSGEPGIFFLAEWLSNRLSVAMGPKIFGLPYRFGRIRYEHDRMDGKCGGTVEDGAGNKLQYRAHLIDQTEGETNEKLLETVPRGCDEASTPLKWGVNEKPCEAGSLEEWLMERYTAFTCVSGSSRRFFRVWHRPWPQVPLSVRVENQSLLEKNWVLFQNSEIVSGNFSPGLKDVWMGWPHRL
jgi:uncharacterized protein YqjF (DUF2071 family)